MDKYKFTIIDDQSLPDGTFSPVSLQYIPGGQLKHPPTLILPVVFENVPIGHLIGIAVDAVQYDPGGHILGSAVPCVTQKYPENKMIVN
jgi:hypothetical protein